MADAPAITIETITAGRLRANGHANFGRHGGGTIWQHTTIARLSAVDKPAGASSTGRPERLWSVDGLPCASLEEAVERLAVPAVLTDEESEVLAHVPAEWTELHDFRTDLGERLGRQLGITLMMLRMKGFVQNELRRVPSDGKVRPFVRLAPASEA